MEIFADRTEPEIKSGTALSIRLFGSCELERDGNPLPRARSRTELWLLSLLVLRRHQALDRDWLAALFWPDSPEERALANLRRSLANLRRVLGSDASRLLSPTPRSVRLDLTGVNVDVLGFDAAVKEEDPTSLKRAVALYRGPLLQGCEEEWIVPERLAREHAYLQALELLASQAGGQGEYSEALRLLQRIVSIDPLRESVHRSLLETLAAAGDYAALDRHYRDLRLALRKEINADPSEETTVLYKRLRTRGRTGMLPCAPENDPAPLRRLPCPLTRLVGRTKEIAFVSACLAQKRLVTLTGSGGVGKTRLAIAVADAVASEYSDGVWFVDLAPLTDPTLVPQTVASALGIQATSGSMPIHSLADTLRPRTLLLVLDNCEHLITACSNLADMLLNTCLKLRVLATSREHLNLPGEQTYRVPSLSVPKRLSLPDFGALGQYEAVQLFLDRVEAAQPAFTLTSGNAPAVAEICSQLDGIPLALELAAARIRVMQVDQIAVHLKDRFRFLTGGGRSTLPRQQTLRALIDWSYDLLAPQEQVLLNRLSVFAGGWTLNAVTAVNELCLAKKGESGESLDLLTALIDKSLVGFELEGPTGRYYLLETVREYALERIIASGEEQTVRERHLQFYLEFAENADDPALETEHLNLRSALAWSLSNGNAPEAAQRLCAALGSFWIRRMYFEEANYWTERALAHPGETSPLVRANILHTSGDLGAFTGRYDSARAKLHECVVIKQALGDKYGCACAMLILGRIAKSSEDYGEAQWCFAEGLSLFEEIGNRIGVAWCGGETGFVALQSRKLQEAETLFERSLSILLAEGDRQAIAWAMHGLALVATEQERFPKACELLEQALSIYEEGVDKLGATWAGHSLSKVLIRMGDIVAARATLESCVRVTREAHASDHEISSRVMLGELCRSTGEYTVAEQHYRESLAIVGHAGDKQRSVTRWKTEIDLWHGLGHTLLHQGEVEEAWTCFGRSLEMAQESGNTRAAAKAIGGLGALAASQGQMERAAILLSAAEAGLHDAVLAPVDQAEWDWCKNTVRAAIGEAEMEKICLRGRTMTSEQAAFLCASDASHAEPGPP